MISFSINFIRSLPRIVIRWLQFTFTNERVVFNEFRAINIYCINGTLNQLVWNVEGGVFITISNSNKIYFKNRESIFLVNNSITEFTITIYGINGIQRHKTGIKVVCLNQKELSNRRPSIFRFEFRKVHYNVIKKHLQICNNQKMIKKEKMSQSLMLNLQGISAKLDKVNTADSILNLDEIIQQV